MITQFTLTKGPSRELLFDCLKHGQTVRDLRVIQFWGEYKGSEGAGGRLFLIEIEGLHRADHDGDSWFFLGSSKQLTSGPTYVQSWQAKSVGFVCGKWDVRRRTGYIKLGDTSFFVNPLLDVENASDAERETDEVRRQALTT